MVSSSRQVIGDLSDGTAHTKVSCLSRVPHALVVVARGRAVVNVHHDDAAAMGSISFFSTGIKSREPQASRHLARNMVRATGFITAQKELAEYITSSISRPGSRSAAFGTAAAS